MDLECFFFRRLVKRSITADKTPATDVITSGGSILQLADNILAVYRTESLKKRGMALHVKQTSVSQKNNVTTTYILNSGGSIIQRVIALESAEDTVFQTEGFYFLMPDFIAGNSSDCSVNVPGPF